MGIKLITPPALEPISVAELKAQERVTSASEDTLLGLIIAAARAKAENYMGAVIMQRTVDQTLDEFPSDGDIEIEQPPAWNSSCVAQLPLVISSITYADEDGADQVLAGSGYALDDSNWPFWVLRAADTDWPATATDQANAVRIRMVKGYDNQANVPGDVRAWLLMTAGFLWVNRESFVVNDRVAEIPSRFVDSLLDPYRVFKV